MKHIPVLLNQAVRGLNLKQGDVCVDATFGGGGHSKLISQNLGATGHLIAIDADAETLKEFDQLLKDEVCQKTAILGNFRQIKNLLLEKNIKEVDAILMDLGTSAGSIENSSRGFTFLKDEPLLMTFKAEISPDDLTAKEIVNTWSEESLADIIYGFGGEKFSRKIAKAIVEQRLVKPIETTFQLVAIIEAVVPIWYKRKRIHPATKTFQALRIAVNDELGALKDGLNDGFELLKPNGRMAVISFHDLEARIVKKFFIEKKTAGQGQIITKHAVKPEFSEIKANSRSRSAQLRIIQKQ